MEIRKESSPTGRPNELIRDQDVREFYLGVGARKWRRLKELSRHQALQAP
jgi:hypothetical protein